MTASELKWWQWPFVPILLVALYMTAFNVWLFLGLLGWLPARLMGITGNSFMEWTRWCFVDLGFLGE